MLDIGKVIYVDPKSFTVDMIGMTQTEYSDLKFMNLYSKPSSKGQGIYMIPEVGSYGIVMEVAGERVVFGFFSHIVDNENLDYDNLMPGDFILKSPHGNKIIGYNDGRISILSSDTCRIDLFPESGNKNDSAGHDNLLRVLCENFDLTTSGGFVKQFVDKKNSEVNLSFEIRNKPLYEHNPDILEMEVGSQGPTGDNQYFITINCKKDDQVSYSYKFKSNGWKEYTSYDDGTEVYKLTIDENYKKTITTNKGYTRVFHPDGSFTEEMQNKWNLTRNLDGELNLDVGGGKLKITLGNNGFEMVADKDITLKTSSKLNIESSGSTTIKANECVIDSGKVDIGNGALENLVKSGFLDLFNAHTHLGNLGAPTAPPVMGSLPVHSTTITKGS